MDEATAYAKHKNLKLAAAELGIAWQVLYTRLREQGVAVTGDKARYGSDKDKFAEFGEQEFQRLVPEAIPQNEFKFQAKVDFLVHGIKVDVKSSMPHEALSRGNSLRWAFSLAKQAAYCEFYCCLCFSKDRDLQHALLMPREIVEGMQTLSVSCSKRRSKWLDYEVQPSELAKFFESMRVVQH
jgi:hypothetical protein